jgi:hypothetical protein
MKTRLKRLALTAFLLSSTGVTFAADGANAVSDLPGFGEEAYFNEDATYATNAEIAPATTAERFVGDSFVGDAALRLPSQSTGSNPYTAASYTSQSGSGYYPETYTPEAYAPESYSDIHYPSSDMAAGCDGGCDSACRPKRKLFSLFDGDCDCWASNEGLVWFAPDRDMPALITTSNVNTLPVLPEGGTNNVQTVFGDDIDGEVSGGFRLDYGKFVTKNVGIGGRFWWMADNNDSYAAAGNGSDMSIGRPFYNIDVPGNDALLVALNGTFTGSIAAQSELKLWGAEAYSRIKLASHNANRIDLIGGYTHFEMEDTLGISSVTITNATARTRRYADVFAADNRFDGGQVGFEMIMNRGRWTARSLTKVHMGNMNQRVRIAGLSTDQTPPAGVNVTSGGLLAMGNQGDFERDTFAFAPEANFKLGFCLRRNVTLTAGYSLIYFDNVTLVGDIIDTSVDGSLLNTGQFGNRPAFEFDDSSLWVQGVDFGVTIEL